MKAALARLRRVFYLLALGTLAQVPPGFADTPAVGVSLQVYSGYAALTITGAAGSNYGVQYVTDLSPTNHWQTLTNLPLPSSPYLWLDASCPATAQRFYRVVGIPASPHPALLAWIEPGTFTLGSPTTELDRVNDEGPQTQVTISRGFWMSRYEVTQEEYLAVMGNDPSYFTGDMKRPAEQMTWYDATNYCGKLTQQERSAGRLPAGFEYRLPTEAEWEYACRAGSTTRFGYGDDLNYANLGGYAWYVGNSDNTPHPVGQKQPNAWGLYDMHGNVFEWCLDYYGPYPGGSVTDPKGPASGSDHVIRGGCWYFDAKDCRSAYRFSLWPDGGDNGLGFRSVLAPAP